MLLQILESTDPQNDDFDNEEGEFSNIEDFVRERIPVNVRLRCLAEIPTNLKLPLTWGYRGLVESGWEQRSTLMEANQTRSNLNLIRLYSRMQEKAGCHSITSVDKWLAKHGVSLDTLYIEQKPSGATPRKLTLLSAVRNMIHYPENRNQILTNTQLEQTNEPLLLALLRPSASQ